MNSFKTYSTARKSIITIILTCIPFFILAFLGLKIAIITWLYFEIILFLVFVFCLYLVAKTHWEIEFKNNDIILINTGNKQRYCINNLTQKDLIIKQTNKQKRRNCCDLKIENTPFFIYEVKHCDELCKYIQSNIPE